MLNTLRSSVDRWSVLLLVVALLALLGAAACTAAQAATAASIATAVGAGAAAMLDIAKPLMTPEQFAEFRMGVEHIDGTVEATQAVLGSVVDAFATFRDAVNAKAVATVDALHATQVALASKADTGEVVGYSVGGGALGTAASRVLSVMKHGPGKVPMPAAPAAPPA